MAQEERNIDAMKYRKSTHIAAVDVSAIIDDKGACILTIKDAYYAKNIDVSGNKTDGYFLEFNEPVKPMVVNSTNRKAIADNLKKAKGLSSKDSRNIGNWIGFSIELYVDENVSMMGKIVDGTRVKMQSPVQQIDTTEKQSMLSGSKTKDELKSNWEKLSPAEKNQPSLLALKEKLKNTLK